MEKNDVEEKAFGHLWWDWSASVLWKEIVNWNVNLQLKPFVPNCIFKQKAFSKASAKLKMLRHKHCINSVGTRFSNKNFIWESLSYLQVLTFVVPRSLHCLLAWELIKQLPGLCSLIICPVQKPGALPSPLGFFYNSVTRRYILLQSTTSSFPSWKWIPEQNLRHWTVMDLAVLKIWGGKELGFVNLWRKTICIELIKIYGCLSKSNVMNLVAGMTTQVIPKYHLALLRNLWKPSTCKLANMKNPSVSSSLL